MKEYELTVLLHPDLEIDLEKPLAKVEKIIKNAKGKIVKKDEWGKRKLAYPIKKQHFGVYVLYKLELEPEAVAKIENVLRITDEVMRHLLVKAEYPPKPEEDSKDDKEKKSTKESKSKQDEEE